MDVWLGVGVVVVVLALSYFTPRRKCGGGGCQGCGSSCSQSGDKQMAEAKETEDSLSR
ncbi:hypothetical protein BH10PLA2_BH10PLA2_39420 [soil metagenome]